MTASALATTPSLPEVYPHPALLSLLSREYRVPYKVAKIGKYWSRVTVHERIEKLLAEFTVIHGHADTLPGASQAHPARRA